MSFNKIKEIPSIENLFETLPVPGSVKKIKSERDKEIKDIFTGNSDKFILIVGPCSADNEDAVLEYVEKLALVNEKVKDKIMIIPRVYTNKPRTTGEGYKGMVHQPDPKQKSNMYEGIIAIRKMHIKAAQVSGLTCADEMLYPENYAYLSDILSYVAIGARSVENQQHRLTVSGLDIPVGIKNATSGDIGVMLNGIKAAGMQHSFILRGWEVETTGNPLAHAILRGATNMYGMNIPNYHYEDILNLINEYKLRKFEYSSIIIDTNHANSGKNFKEQPRIALDIIRNRIYDEKVKDMVKGLMIESYLVEGSQKIEDNIYGKSITDPCLGWNDTERLIYNIAEKL